METNDIKIRIYKDFKTTYNGEDWFYGSTAFVSWSTMMEKGVNQSIGLRSDEKVNGIEVSEKGVFVSFRKVKQ